MKSRKAADGRWIADLRVNGVGPQVLCDSQRAADDMVVEAKSRQKARRGMSRENTLQDAADLFLGNCRLNGYADNTLGSYGRILRIHVIPHFPGRILDIDVAQVALFRALPPALGPANRYSPLLMLAAVLDEAWGADWIPRNPVDDLPEVRRRVNYNRPKAHKRLRMPDQYEWGACVASSSGVLHLLICLCLLAGLRIDEALRLTWDAVDWATMHIRIDSTAIKRGPKGTGGRTDPKTSTSRRMVPMSAYIRGMLLAHLQASVGKKEDRIARLPDGSDLDYGKAMSLLKTLLRQLKICRIKPGTEVLMPAFGFHAFRHACVSRWIHSGIELPKIMRWIGHKRPTTTLDIYAYVLRDYAAITDLEAASSLAAIRPWPTQIVHARKGEVVKTADA